MVLVKQAPIFGRIGESFGKGLSEMLPEELAYRRKAAGLKAFAEKVNDLDPAQSVAELASVYGITPQILQTFSEMYNLQRQKKAHENIVARKKQEFIKEPFLSQKPSVSTPEGRFGVEKALGSMSEQDFSEKDSDRKQSLLDVAKKLPWQSARRREQSVPSPEEPVREIYEEPFLDERALPRVPWSTSERAEVFNDFIQMGFSAPEAEIKTNDAEKRYLASPEAYRARQDFLKAKSIEAKKEFESQLEQKLQKTGDEVYKDIIGEVKSNFERGMERDLVSRPNLSVKSAANEWSNKALDLAKTKTDFYRLAKTTGIESFFKENEVYDQLATYSKIFSEYNSSEEYFNLLQSKMGLTPQSAAYIAYPVNKNIENYISSIPYFQKNKKGRIDPTNYDLVKEVSQKAAMDIIRENMIEENDSILSIAKSLSRQIFQFSHRDFFQVFRNNMDKIGLNARQRREIAKGEPGLIKTNWADAKIMPSKKPKRD